MQDQRREVEAGEGAEGRGGARNEIGLADRADDAAQCGVGRFHIGLFRSGGFRRNVLLHLIEHCNCRHSAADPERAAVTAQPAAATMMHAIRSEEHTSELQSLMRTSSAVFCLKKKKQKHTKSTSQ